MTGFCTVDSNCVEWPQPDWQGFPCDPCIRPDDPDHLVLLDRAWRLAVDYVLLKTGGQWPGRCWRETFRPSWTSNCGHPPNDCSCCGTGAYRWLPAEGVTCWPILDVECIEIGPTGCNPCGQIWTPGDGVRLEWVNGEPRVVMESEYGCCGQWPSQDLCRCNGAACTWSVSFITGCDPPPIVLEGVAAFAAEWVKECINRKCLPGNISRKSFDGTTSQYDPTQPPQLALRILQEILDMPQPVQEWAYGGVNPISWHSVGRPARLCPELCPDTCLHSCAKCFHTQDECSCNETDRLWLIEQAVAV